MRDTIELIISTSWKPNYENFLNALGVSKGGFGEQLLKEVYDGFFLASIDAKLEFKKYYSVEYSNFFEYVDIRYGLNLDDEDIEKEHTFLVTWLPMIVDSAYDGNKLDTVLECIRMLEEAQNEN